MYTIDGLFSFLSFCYYAYFNWLVGRIIKAQVFQKSINQAPVEIFQSGEESQLLVDRDFGFFFSLLY